MNKWNIINASAHRPDNATGNGVCFVAWGLGTNSVIIDVDDFNQLSTKIKMDCVIDVSAEMKADEKWNKNSNMMMMLVSFILLNLIDKPNSFKIFCHKNILIYWVIDGSVNIYCGGINANIFFRFWILWYHCTFLVLKRQDFLVFVRGCTSFCAH